MAISQAMVIEQQKSIEIVSLKESLYDWNIVIEKFVTIMPITFTKHFQKPLL